jgi:hypothetical protein
MDAALLCCGLVMMATGRSPCTAGLSLEVSSMCEQDANCLVWYNATSYSKAAALLCWHGHDGHRAQPTYSRSGP